MKLFQYVALSLIALVSSCRNEGRSTSSEPRMRLEAIVVDSLMVDHVGPLLLVDACENYFLAVDDFTHSLLVFDQMGAVFSEFPHSEEPFDKPAKIISAGFIGDSLIMATSHQFISIYSIQGEIKEVLRNKTFNIIVNNNLHLDLEDIHIAGTPYAIYFLEGGKDLPVQETRYWRETKLLTLMNLNTKESFTRLNYEKASIYRNNEKFYYKHSKYIAINSSRTELYLSYQLDKNIYVYDLSDESLQLKDKIATHPLYFEEEPVSSKFGSGSEKAMLTANATDSRYSSLKAIGDSTIVAQYGTYAPMSALTGDESTQELLEKWIGYFQGYLEVYDRFSKEKISKDIRLDRRLWNLKLARKDTLIFEGFHFDDPKEKNYNVFYKVILK